MSRPFLNASKRELLADCALPVSVLLMSFFGSYVFRDVKRTYNDLYIQACRVGPGHPFSPLSLHFPSFAPFTFFFSRWL